MEINHLNLSFPESEEKRFRVYYFENSLWAFRISFLVVTLLYAAFGYLDALLLDQETAKLFHLLRFGVVIPFLLIVLTLSFFLFFKKIWQELLLCSGIIAGTAIVWMIAMAPDNITYYAGLMLVISSCYFFIKLRFVPATIVGWSLLIIFNVVMQCCSSVGLHLMIAYNFFYVSANIIGMFAAYHIEYFIRQNYWLARELSTSKYELHNHYEKAKKSLHFKQIFLANLSHEIRTPLTGIMGLIKILENLGLKEEQKEHFQSLKLSGHNLMQIINQVLDFSKIEAGKIHLQKTALTMQDFMEKARKYFESVRDNKELAFHVNIDKNVPQVLLVDQNRVFQIVMNLISNATKYTTSGFISISVKLSSYIGSDGCRILMEVKDTGVGITPQDQKKLFDPFFQSDASDTRSLDGTGLGLSICNELVKHLQGKIGVKSEVGKGSCFWFTFEAELSNNKRIIEDANTEPNQQPGKQSKDVQLSILLVEDKKVNQKVIGLLLIDKGHEVSFAENGLQAIEKYTEQRFDLILMDIQMPVMDGIQATQKLKSRFDNLPPIVGLSANAFEGDKEKYIKAGMDDYLTKPFDEDDFSRVIHRFWGGEITLEHS